MARINSNIPSLIANANLQRANADLDVRLERLATGVRINRGKDDPAGLIISQRLRTDIEGVNQAVKNAERASSVIATTEGALNEVNDLLSSIKSLMVEAANTGAFSKEERDANQRQIDSAIDSITRISNTASFGGLKLLNGELDYTTSDITTSQISKATVNNATFLNQSSIQVDVDVVGSAQKGSIFFRGVPVGNSTIASSMQIEVAGTDGVTVLSFTSGTSMSAIMTAVNNQAGFTGVEAALVDSGQSLVFRAVDYGSDSFVSVKRLGYEGAAPDPFTLYRFADGANYPSLTGAINWSNPDLSSQAGQMRDTGQDVSALVNGNLANGRGLELNVNSTNLGMELILEEPFAIDPTATNSTFQITGGGSLFQIGPDITVQQQTNIGIPSVAASKLGGTLVGGTLQFLNSLKTGAGNSIEENVGNGNDFTTSQKVLDQAIDEVSLLRGRLGAFERNVLQTSVRSAQAAFENLSASESRIRDADFAEETSKLTRAQILSASATQILGLANQQSQQVLQLLG